MRLLMMTVVLTGACRLPARTIELTDTDCRLIATIRAEAPRSSWAGVLAGHRLHNLYIDLDTLTNKGSQAFLIQFPLSSIPKEMNIVKAELLLPVIRIGPKAVEPRLVLYRILAPWGAGVCHLYRMTEPERLTWATPGAAAPGRDRAMRASAVVEVEKRQQVAMNVTEDVDLWHSGAANYGWLLTLDQPRQLVRLTSPTWTPGAWKLRVTYEPQ